MEWVSSVRATKCIIDKGGRKVNKIVSLTGMGVERQQNLSVTGVGGGKATKFIINQGGRWKGNKICHWLELEVEMQQNVSLTWVGGGKVTKFIIDRGGNAIHLVDWTTNLAKHKAFCYATSGKSNTDHCSQLIELYLLHFHFRLWENCCYCSMVSV